MLARSEGPGRGLLTTSLWSLLVKLKTGWMVLNLLRISLCLAMSVARIHLKRRSFEPTKAWRERPELFTTDLLDHHSADLLVLFTGQVFKDVALWLKIKKLL